MGLDAVGYRACLLASTVRGGLGDVLTLGRQSMSLSPSFAHRSGIPTTALRSPFCEQVLVDCLGASSVASVDMSAYEGATYSHDLNEPLPERLREAYDSVIDLGTLEHIFDVRTAFGNAGQACKPGGYVVHVLPANQQCGHGLYQFSPEFMHSYYTPSNGYESLTVFVVQVGSPDVWYRVPSPADGERINIRSATDLYLVSLAQKQDSLPYAVVQQSDYRSMWTEVVPNPVVFEAPGPSQNAPTQARATLSTSRQLRRVRQFVARSTAALRLASRPVVSDAYLERLDFADVLAMQRLRHRE